MKHIVRSLAAIALLSFIACGCTMTNRATAVDEVTLSRESPATRSATDPCPFQLVRVEPDGTVILRSIDAQTEIVISGKPGQTIFREQTSGSQWQITILSSDPASQRATIRGTVTKTVRPAWW